MQRNQDTAAGRALRLGAVYRHFKGDLYLVEDVVTHSETGERYVLYRQLYGDCRRYVRPYELFVSRVDREKYPEAKQEYRFALENIESVNPHE